MATDNIADLHARLQRLVDSQELLLPHKPPLAGKAGDDSTFENVSDQASLLRLTPVSAQNSEGLLRSKPACRLLIKMPGPTRPK
ncbi:hypothetical protein ACVWZV_000813 [Bradyrhizobium sp. GM5.1]